MVVSNWKCPKCKEKLFLTNAARYWCTTCQREQPALLVDPCNRDFSRLVILMDMTIERTLGVSYERR